MVLLEYIWLDNKSNFRSKTKVIDKDFIDKDSLETWNYDGSSTGQATGEDSEVYIKPVALYKDPFRVDLDGYLVLCDTWLPSEVKHPDNTREVVRDLYSKKEIKEAECMFGFEQEFFFIDPKTNRPLGFPEEGDPEEQGKYYCGVGHGKCYGRTVAEEILDNSIYAGLNITGMNFEVAPGQCELQLCDVGLKAADDLLILRYIMIRTAENHNLIINLHPKPEEGNWNGSGCHTNFSTKQMREDGGYEKIIEAINKLKDKHKEHIDNYGLYNNLRLTGRHETADINTFSYGVANRGASVRIPRFTARDNKGYLEDRRPSSNMDPYKVVEKLTTTILL